ncbi:MAG TPA: ABC transporter substrate-binding protein [Clostridiales bacterium UBA8960]|jgi:putative spermidine/putrescine transport system substrate-binding protein|nr:ABC transporter substrate-binding protein [Clostridiales bacterium UBA8960]
MKRLVAVSVIMILLLTSCTFNIGSNDPEAKNWELIVKSAEKSMVTIAIEHTNPLVSEWFKGDYSKYMKANYDIDVTIIEQSILKTMDKLVGDKAGEVTFGDIDIILIENEGFKNAYNRGLLYGPFSDKLPNVKQNLDMRSLNMTSREGIKTNGYSVPYSRSQLSFIYNQDVFYETPTNFSDLIQLIKQNKNRFTYPDPRVTKEGEAFIFSILSEYIDFEDFLLENFDRVAFGEAITPGIDRLIELKPYLFENGTKYPQTIRALDDLFINGALMMSLSMQYNYVTDKLREYEYPENASTFIIPTGVATYDEIAAIAFNSPNKSGAMVALDALLSPAMQASKYNPRVWGSLPVYDAGVVPSTSLEGFTAMRLRSTTVGFNAFMNAVMPQFSPEMRAVVLERWEKDVLSSTDE